MFWKDQSGTPAQNERDERIQRRLADKADRRGLMAALDEAQALIWFDPNGRVLDSNANIQRLFERDGHELITLTYFDLIGVPPPVDGATQRRWDRIASGAMPNEERSFVTSSGGEVWTSANYAAIRSEDGQTRRVFAIIIDLSPWSWKPNDAAMVGSRF